jgi:uncharacterized protein (TIGR02145 family)
MKSVFRLHIFVFILIIFGPNNIFAQLREFEVSDMPTPSTTSVQAKNMEDALVFVYSSLPDLNFRSTVGGISEQRYNKGAGRYEIFVKSVAQILSVQGAGFMEGRLARVNPTAKEVFYFKVEEKKSDAVGGGQGKYKIITDPPGCTVFINEMQMAAKTPFEGELPAGPIKIGLKKGKYLRVDTIIKIRPNELTYLNLEMVLASVWLNIVSNPSGAKVLLDGKNIGRTPFSEEIDLSESPKGIQTELQIQLDDYKIVTQPLFLSISPTPKELNFELKRKEGLVRINSTPAGAKVFINSLYKGLTPFATNYGAGKYTLELKAEGYITLKQDMVVSESGLNLDLALTPKETQGRVDENAEKQTWKIASKEEQSDAKLDSIEDAIERRFNQPTISKPKQEVTSREVQTSKTEGKTSEASKIFGSLVALNANSNVAQTQTQSEKNASGTGNKQDYKTITFGSQIWMAENLSVSKYANGDPIANISDDKLWIKSEEGAWCDYLNNPSFENPYGKLYNYYAIIDKRNLCPTGWHVPTEDDYNALFKFLGKASRAGAQLMEPGTAHWAPPNKDSRGTGFMALPGGIRAGGGKFVGMGKLGFFWTSSKSFNGSAMALHLHANDEGAGMDNYDRNAGYSVRCLKN